MWANKEMVELVEWLKQYNLNNNKQKKEAGFYGLDLYSLWESMDEIIKYLKKVDPSALKNAIDAYNCFEPYNREEEKYAHATAFVSKNCEEEVIEMLISLQNKIMFIIKMIKIIKIKRTIFLLNKMLLQQKMQKCITVLW